VQPPAVTQDSLVTPSATRVAGFPNGRPWTPQSHLEASLTIGFRGDLRARSCAACDNPDLRSPKPRLAADGIRTPMVSLGQLGHEAKAAITGRTQVSSDSGR
jgi:hypothetical protein